MYASRAFCFTPRVSSRYADAEMVGWLVGWLQEGAGRRRKDARDAVTRRESGYPFSKLLRARGAVPNV